MWVHVNVLISNPLFSLLFFFSSFCFPSGCEVRGPCGPGAHLTFRSKDRPQDDDARGGPCGPWEAAAAGVTPHPAAAANPEAAPDCRVSETAWELDTAAPGSASGAHQGSKCLLASDLFPQGAWTWQGHKEEPWGKAHWLTWGSWIPP